MGDCKFPAPSECGPPWLQELGYQHGKTLFDVWQRSGVVDSMLKDRRQEEFHRTGTGHVSAAAKYAHVQVNTLGPCILRLQSMRALRSVL